MNAQLLLLFTDVLVPSAYGGHAERLPERPVLHQQRDPDAAAAVGQHEHPAEEQAGGPQPPQPAGGRAGGAWSHDLVSVTAADGAKWN